jgi:hypothetical protein
VFVSIQQEEAAFLRASIQAAEKKKEVEDRILQNKWKLEDEERQVRYLHDLSNTQSIIK